MKNIFVGNLWTSHESPPCALFEPYGKLERVNLVTNRANPDATLIHKLSERLGGANRDAQQQDVCV